MKVMVCTVLATCALGTQLALADVTTGLPSAGTSAPQTESRHEQQDKQSAPVIHTQNTSSTTKDKTSAGEHKKTSKKKIKKSSAQ